MLVFKNILYLLLDLSYYLVKFSKRIFQNKNSVLRILIHHDIKSDDQINSFKNQIQKLSKEYDFISPKEFEKIIQSGKLKGKKLLLTFDDGFKSNRVIAESVLKNTGIKAIFFIISDFIGLKINSLNYSKIIRNIYPNGPTLNELSEPMDFDDIQFLINSGHTIGCHTATHKMLSKISKTIDLKEELVDSKNNLEKTFNIKIKHIAYPFGTFESIDKKSLKLISESYEFVHTGLRGNNIKEQKLLYRDATNPETKTTRLKAFLLGNADFIYKNKLKTLKSFLIDTI